MQIFTVFWILAILAVSNGASIAPNHEREVGQPRAVGEVQAVILTPSEFREAVETAGWTRIPQLQSSEEVAVAASTSDHQEGTAPGRPRRWLLRRRPDCGHAQHGACFGRGCGPHTTGGCADGNCGSGAGCGGATPCDTNTVVVHQEVPVAHPVPVHVPVVKVVHQNVPVLQPVAVPVVNVVHVPVPVASKPCCSQPQSCCGQAPQPCSSCSG